MGLQFLATRSFAPCYRYCVRGWHLNRHSPVSFYSGRSHENNFNDNSYYEMEKQKQRRGSFTTKPQGKMSYRDARRIMDVGHSETRLKFRQWAETKQLHKIEAYLSQMDSKCLTARTRTTNQALLAYGSDSAYMPKVFELLKQMDESGPKPNLYTYAIVFSICAHHFPNYYQEAYALHRSLYRRQIKVDVPVANAAIKVFAKYGDGNTALKIYQEMRLRDLTSAEPTGRVVKHIEGPSTMRVGQVYKEDGDGAEADPLRAAEIVKAVFSPYNGLIATKATYMSLFQAAARDSRLRLFRPSKFLAANLTKLEALWTPDVRRRFSLQMADALWGAMTHRQDIALSDTMFCAYLTVYRDAGRVDFISLREDFVDERHKQLLREKTQKKKFDASSELMEYIGGEALADAELRQKAAIDEHLDTEYPDDADDAAAAFWVNDMEVVKAPLTPSEKAAQDRNTVPFGSVENFLQEMVTADVAPTTDVFAMIWQCQSAAIISGPMHSQMPQTVEVRKALGKLDPSRMLLMMKKYKCEISEEFFLSLLRHHAIRRSYADALDTLHSAAHMNIKVTLRHYRELAHCCLTQEQGFDVLLDMKEHGLVPDSGIYECLIMAAFNSRQYPWVQRMLEMLIESGCPPTADTVEVLRRRLRNPGGKGNPRHNPKFRSLENYAVFTFLPFVQPREREFDVDPETAAFLGLDKEEPEQEGPLKPWLGTQQQLQKQEEEKKQSSLLPAASKRAKHRQYPRR